MKRLKKIVIYCGELPPPTFIDRLIVGLAQEDFKLYISGRKRGALHYPKQISVLTYSGKISQIFTVLLYTFLLWLQRPKDKKVLDNWIKKRKVGSFNARLKFYPILYQRPAAVHLQWVKSISDWTWVKKLDIKLVVSLRGAHINYTPIANPEYVEIYKKCFPLVDGFHAVSDAIKIEAKAYGLIEQKSKVIYSGLDLNNFSFKTEKKSNSKLQIISIGRGHWKKGYDNALDGLKILKDKNVSFHYTIVGIEENEELLFQRKQLGLEKEVTFLMKMDFESVKLKIQTSDILLLPSVEEGIANVAIEAMALGTMVVSTDCGGMMEVIKDNENGFIFKVRNIEQMADKIQYVMNLSNEKQRKIIENARITVENQHSAEKMIHSFSNFYKEIINE
ncbi:MAG: glycosyltransferase family 4 protein [Flavobacterium sp.]|jgi:colanic acid/amylovoran biosynthesis glycosyltransferase|uniref:glycosyltransferase family 4 protein n=1 Tax=Flavobacterium sp. TaxID=239 RepID=UPI003BA7151E